MKKLTFLVISLMTSASANAQTTPTTNSIYIDQVGDGSTISLTQEGESNTIGVSEAADDRFVLAGNEQTVTVKQDGNSNIIKGSVEQANGVVYNTTVTGDNNTLEYDQGKLGSIEGSVQTLTITGVSNDLTFNQGTASSATGANQTITITGDTNTLTSTINTDDVVNTKTIAGSGNVITTEQIGSAGKNIEMVLTGSENIVTVKQEGQGSDSINIKLGTPTTPNVGSTLIINQCGAPPC